MSAKNLDSLSDLSIAIPTFNRGEILCKTLTLLLDLPVRAAEIVVVDQTREHPPEVAAKLAAWSEAGAIRLVALPFPSIPKAMNVALREARSRHVLYVDDDVTPSQTLLHQHLAAYAHPGVWAVVGQVLQPGEEPAHFPDERLRDGLIRDLEFRFNHDDACDVQNVIACNLSVDRERALALGGFDENYIAVAYRFETDFALRIVRAGGRVRFHPAATLRHLKIPSGGVRAWGDHKTSASPMHSVGDYYFALHHAPSFWSYAAHRLRKNVLTRFHLRQPWHIPAKLIGELRGLRLAHRLFSQKAGSPRE